MKAIFVVDPYCQQYCITTHTPTLMSEFLPCFYPIIVPRGMIDYTRTLRPNVVSLIFLWGRSGAWGQANVGPRYPK